MFFSYSDWAVCSGRKECRGEVPSDHTTAGHLLSAPHISADGGLVVGCSSTFRFPNRTCSFPRFILPVLSPQLVLPAPEPESVISPRSRVPFLRVVLETKIWEPVCSLLLRCHSFWASSADRAREQGVCSVITVIVGRQCS